MRTGCARETSRAEVSHWFGAPTVQTYQLVGDAVAPATMARAVELPAAARTELEAELEALVARKDAAAGP